MLATSLAVGARLVTIARWSPEALLQAIQDRRVTYLHMITTVMVDITKLDPAVCARYDTSHLRQTWCGGGAIGPDLLAAYESRVGGVGCEGWGRSEGGMSWNSAGGRCRKVGTQGSVLRQICELRIVDPEGNDVPTGEEGEILVRGDTVISSYWRAARPGRSCNRWRGLDAYRGHGAHRRRWICHFPRPCRPHDQDWRRERLPGRG